MESVNKTCVEITKVITNLILRLCFICYEEDINLEKMDCRGNYVHKHCQERWMRILVPSSENCAMCRKELKKPHAEAQAADSDFMMRIAALCEDNHPEIDNSPKCIACIYFNKGLNPIQQHDFAFAIQCIFACRSVNENENSDHEICDHCQRLIEKVYSYF